MGIMKHCTGCTVHTSPKYTTVKKAQMQGGVCKYYIGPIGDLSLSTATAAATARIHLHGVIKIKFQK